VNLGAVQKAIDSGKLDTGATIDHAALKAASLARGGKDGVRLLAKGELTAKINLLVAGASQSAIDAVEKAGGKVEVIEVVPAAEKAKAKKGSAIAAKKAAKQG
jgi:large subunit ribosomal protein L15